MDPQPPLHAARLFPDASITAETYDTYLVQRHRTHHGHWNQGQSPVMNHDTTNPKTAPMNLHMSQHTAKQDT